MNSIITLLEKKRVRLPKVQSVHYAKLDALRNAFFPSTFPLSLDTQFGYFSIKWNLLQSKGSDIQMNVISESHIPRMFDLNVHDMYYEFYCKCLN